jgi:hypothetical protein
MHLLVECYILSTADSMKDMSGWEAGQAACNYHAADMLKHGRVVMR